MLGRRGALLEPRIGGRYELVRKLGMGGMATVYEALDVRIERRVALKLMHERLADDADLMDRFLKESRVLGDIDSPHLVRMLDGGVDDDSGRAFVVMELLEGEDLQAMIERQGALEPSLVVALLGQAAHALDRTMAAFIVHRDIKPSNLHLGVDESGSPVLTILDFGLAKALEESGATTRALGSPLYMAPEQIEGDGAIDGRADLYSLAHVAFTLLTGRPYWEIEYRRAGSVYALLLDIVNGVREAPSLRAARLGVALPAAFDRWFERATRAAPAERFESAREMVDALAAAFHPAARAAPARRWIAPAAVVGCAVLAALCIGALSGAPPTPAGRWAPPATALVRHTATASQDGHSHGAGAPLGADEHQPAPSAPGAALAPPPRWPTRRAQGNWTAAHSKDTASPQGRDSAPAVSAAAAISGDSREDPTDIR
jgi:serine/threonine-protein kinase